MYVCVCRGGGGGGGGGGVGGGRGGGGGGGVGACVCVRGHISSLISLPSSDGSEKLSCIFTHDIDASVLEFA